MYYNPSIDYFPTTAHPVMPYSTHTTEMSKLTILVVVMLSVAERARNKFVPVIMNVSAAINIFLFTSPPPKLCLKVHTTKKCSFLLINRKTLCFNECQRA